MLRLGVALLGAMFFVGASSGCQNDDRDMHKGDMHDSSMRSSAVDDCSHCPGNQVAKADGTCPECGMKVK